MEIQVIQIGNSRGIRLNKTIIDKYNIRDVVNLELRKNHINISPPSQPRKGWDKAFMEMNEKGDDNLFLK